MNNIGNSNDQLEKSRLQSRVLDYKRTNKLLKCGIAAIAILLVLLLIFLLIGRTNLRVANVGKTPGPAGADGADGASGADGLDGLTPYIGENGNWWIGDTDLGISPEGADGEDGADGAAGANGLTPYIGENGNWWIGNNDLGVSASGTGAVNGINGTNGTNGVDGLTPYIGANGHWWVGDKDLGISAEGAQGVAGINGVDGADGSDGKDGIDGINGINGADGADGADGLTPYIGDNGNWWIGDVDTGVPATGSGGSSGGSGTTPLPGDGSFTVQLGDGKGNKSIAVSETRGFANPTHELKTNGLDDAWNITLADIPVDTIDSDVGGANNGHEYFAYTFFLKNTGTEALDYNELLTLTENKLDAVKAMRYMVYRNGTRTIYASPAADGSKEDFACDSSFTGDVNLVSNNWGNLQPGDVVRYTVVIWFEGNDPECVNDIMGGSVKLNLGFKIVD